MKTNWLICTLGKVPDSISTVNITYENKLCSFTLVPNMQFLMLGLKSASSYFNISDNLLSKKSEKSTRGC